MTMLDQVKHKLIVSCQAEDGFPLNAPHHLAALAATVVMGGASAIRASAPDNLRAIRQAVNVPIIGIYKQDYPGFEVRITPTLSEIQAIAEAGIDMIALDATDRPRPGQHSLAQLIAEIRQHYHIPIMADISTVAEGLNAVRLGCDVLSTTLSGYTSYSPQRDEPDFQLVRDLIHAVDVPIFAEGRISTPEDVRAALDAGAHAVVVGSMITRPHLITERFVAGTLSDSQRQPVIALDIGGTKIAGGVIDAQANSLIEDRIATPIQGGQQILDSTIEFIRSLLRRYNGIQPAAVGISTGGQIDRDGNIIGATDMIPDWIDLPLKQTIADVFNLPVTVINDGQAAALAEAHYGAGSGYASVLCIVIGTGLGGGLVINGKLQHGSHGLAGSIGQIKITPDGSSYLPLEALVSGPGLVGLYNQRPGVDRIVSSGYELAQRAQAGDMHAVSVIQQAGTWLGLGLSHALHTSDTACVVIGGSVSLIGEMLFEATRRSLAQHGHSTVKYTPILPAAFGARAGLIGAAVSSRISF